MHLFIFLPLCVFIGNQFCVFPTNFDCFDYHVFIAFTIETALVIIYVASSPRVSISRLLEIVAFTLFSKQPIVLEAKYDLNPAYFDYSYRCRTVGI